MADRLIKTETLTDIADAIRERTETTATINPRDFASHIRTLEGESLEAYDEAVTVDDGATVVFDEDYTEGYEEGEVAGYNNGVEAGKQAEYDEHWDTVQNYGTRKDYRAFFAYSAYVYINPKHLINASNADSIMTQTGNLESVNWEKFNLSATSSLYAAFSYSKKLKRIDTDLGCSDPSTGTLLNAIFRECVSLESVQKLTVYPTAVLKNSFDNCIELVHIVIDGTIDAGTPDFHWSTKLSKASITSIIEHLSTTTSGLTVTLSKTAVESAFGSTTSTEWTTLIGTRSNWTVALV